MIYSLITYLIPLVPRFIIRKVANQFIAGESVHDAISLGKQLKIQGFLTTIDILGEDINTLLEASQATDEYLLLIEKIVSSNIDRNISLKLSRFGLKIDKDTAFEEFKKIIDSSLNNDIFIRIDMEDSTLTDKTLDFYHRAQKLWPKTGIVLQARLKRTIADALKISKITSANVRLCKGIYPESPSIAYTDIADIRKAYLTTLKTLLDHEVFVGIATHDRILIEMIQQEIAQNKWNENLYEFQALLGLGNKNTLAEMIENGFSVRIYLPFGTDWYAYSLRRFKENPELTGKVMLSLLRK